MTVSLDPLKPTCCSRKSPVDIHTVFTDNLRISIMFTALYLIFDAIRAQVIANACIGIASGAAFITYLAYQQIHRRAVRRPIQTTVDPDEPEHVENSESSDVANSPKALDSDSDEMPALISCVPVYRNEFIPVDEEPILVSPENRRYITERRSARIRRAALNLIMLAECGDYSPSSVTPVTQVEPPSCSVTPVTQEVTQETKEPQEVVTQEVVTQEVTQETQEVTQEVTQETQEVTQEVTQDTQEVTQVTQETQVTQDTQVTQETKAEVATVTKETQEVVAQEVVTQEVVTQPQEVVTQPQETQEAKPQEAKPQEAKPQEAKPQEAKEAEPVIVHQQIPSVIEVGSTSMLQSQYDPQGKNDRACVPC